MPDKDDGQENARSESDTDFAARGDHEPDFKSGQGCPTLENGVRWMLVPPGVLGFALGGVPGMTVFMYGEQVTAC